MPFLNVSAVMRRVCHHVWLRRDMFIPQTSKVRAENTLRAKHQAFQTELIACCDYLLELLERMHFSGSNSGTWRLKARAKFPKYLLLGLKAGLAETTLESE